MPGMQSNESQLIPILAKCDCLLFDFDGTLAPNLDLPDMRKQVIVMCNAYQVPEAVYSGLYIVEVIEAAKKHLASKDPEQAEEFSQNAHQLIRSIELKEASKTNPFTWAEDLLVSLRSRSIKLGVVTRNCREAVLYVFPQLQEYVDCLIARDDTRYLKPDIRHLKTALEKMGTNSEKSAMIGDGELDMVSGKKLGLTCIGVLTGNTTKDDLSLAGANLVISECKDILIST